MAIDALPTKGLFIDMLTRDIQLIPAILDLVDNSVDGAIRLRGDESLAGLESHITISDDRLSVSDNCGGIPVETAEKYAFRFGRPDEMPLTPGSVGRFGVGMKRSFFKLGKRFRVESITPAARFVVDVDVEKWKEEENWQFEFSEIDTEMDNDEEEVGTVVTVSELHADVADQFALGTFRSQLADDLKTRLGRFLSRGLIVTLNGTPAHADPLRLLSASEIEPAEKTIDLRPGGTPVQIRIVVGLGSADRAEAGWHVFCNGRLVLAGDKSSATGWGERDEGRMPAYHGQFRYFRGYVFFTSSDAGLLPWNTTKTGLDADSPVYRRARQEMLTLARGVINFLNHVKREEDSVDKEESSDSPGPAGPYSKLLTTAQNVALDEADTRPKFTLPKVKKKQPTERTQTIKYKKPKTKIDEVKNVLGVSTLTDVGSDTFDYFYDAECSS